MLWSHAISYSESHRFAVYECEENHFCLLKCSLQSSIPKSKNCLAPLDLYVGLRVQNMLILNFYRQSALTCLTLKQRYIT